MVCPACRVFFCCWPCSGASYFSSWSEEEEFGVSEGQTHCRVGVCVCVFLTEREERCFKSFLFFSKVQRCFFWINQAGLEDESWSLWNCMSMKWDYLVIPKNHGISKSVGLEIPEPCYTESRWVKPVSGRVQWFWGDYRMAMNGPQRFKDFGGVNL